MFCGRVDHHVGRTIIVRPLAVKARHGLSSGRTCGASVCIKPEVVGRGGGGGGALCFIQGSSENNDVVYRTSVRHKVDSNHKMIRETSYRPMVTSLPNFCTCFTN